MSSKTVLVTGAAGSLGSKICRALSDKNYNVVGTDVNHGDFVFRSDCFDLTSHIGQMYIQRMMEESNPDFVIHCAATIYGVAGFNDNGYDIFSNDVLMLKNVLDAAPKECKFIYTSSSMVYENVPPQAEGAMEHYINYYPPPITGYGLSKYVGENMVRLWNEKTDQSYTIWRPFNIITPYETADKHQGYSHVFADFFENILIKKLNPLPLIGDGNQIRCFTWIDEVVECIVDNLENPATENKQYNIGNFEPITMKILATMIFREAQARGYIDNKEILNFETEMSFARDVIYRVPNVVKAEMELGFKAQVKTETSVRFLMDEWEKKL